jgi:predicted dehydrogenase
MRDAVLTISENDSFSSMVEKPRLGFLGLGRIGRHRLEAVIADASAEICGIADTSAEAKKEASAMVPAAFSGESLEELLELDLDGVVIATPSAQHASQTIVVLESGCAVYCQKPLARTAEETKRVVAAARGADLLLGVDFCYRHTAAMQAIRELIREGELGEIYGIELKFHNAYGPDKAWFYDPASAGGGCLMDLGIHLVDLALWCLDFPPVKNVSGQLLRSGKRASHAEVEDYALAQFTIGDSTAAQLACSWKAHAGCDAWIEAVFFGTKGGARFRNLNGSFYDFVAERFLPNRSTQVLTEPPDSWGGRGIVRWSRQLAKSRKFDPKAENLIRVASVLDDVYQAHL